ncbi:MAG: M48 family metalloprotease [Proteobacteria bacterium]|nr:M48 family metalloprotease [Pseudomonadota bacterium]
MTPSTFQAERDRQLRERLSQEASIQRVLEALARQPEKLGTRRHFLSRALRLTPTIAPDLHTILERGRSILEVPTEVELYVYPAAEFNAACARPERGRVFVLFSSSLLEAFAPDELAFVLGHELGHHVFDHHGLPLGALLHESSGVPARTALDLFAWQRYAEISADRAGLVVAGSLDAAARSLFKLSSGLRTAPGPEQIKAFIDQAHELVEEIEGTESNRSAPSTDWMASHPFSPIRLRAAQAFAASTLMQGPQPLALVETQVQESMRLMEPSYLDEDSDAAEAMRRYLFAAGVVLSGMDGEITKSEVATLRSLLGAARVPDTLNPVLLRDHLQERADKVRTLVGVGRRAQLVRDLSLIAKADEHTHASERAFLRSCAEALDVPESTADIALGEPKALD